MDPATFHSLIFLFAFPLLGFISFCLWLAFVLVDVANVVVDVLPMRLALVITELLCSLFLVNISSYLLYYFCCIKSTIEVVVVLYIDL